MKKSKEKIEFESSDGNPFELFLNKSRYILLYGEIDEKLSKEINTKLLALSFSSPNQPIVLEINSPGGCVADGISIMNTIRSIPSTVITLINGEACSMGGIISVVGDHRVITPNSYWLGHPMSDFVGGNPQTIKDRGVYLDKLESNLFQVFKEKTLLSEVEFKQMMNGELWLDATECLNKKIVDEIQPYRLTEIKPAPKKHKK